MVRPRWHDPVPPEAAPWWRGWDRFVALWATLNLLWVGFDLSYVPLRTFWLQRNLYPLPSVPLKLPLTALPDVTPLYDRVKGIEPHRETRTYLLRFEALDRALQQPGADARQQADLRAQQLELTSVLIDTNPFAASGASGTLEKIKNRLRERADLDSAKASAERLLSDTWLRQHPWSRERLFWRKEVLPLVATNYWRSIDENGRPTDHFWRIDLLVFQWVFLLDILLRLVRLRRRLPGLSWRQACLRRWTDLPLLLPFWRPLRLVSVIERLQSSGLVNFEPLRAVLSRGVVALLAVELFEVLALQLVDGLQQLIRSPQWPTRIRALRSHQSVPSQGEWEVVELLRIWGPMVLAQVAPRLAPELRSIVGHALQQSFRSAVLPPSLRSLQPVLQVEQELSRQLASGVVDNLLGLSRSTGQRLELADDQQVRQVQDLVDRFWEELAGALESGQGLVRSQQLICALLENLKLTYLAQINRAGIEQLMQELDALMLTVPTGEVPPTSAGDQSL
ncbi:hypothetical protein [Cyanobium sp. Morenito 9A2]|uniref:hypothetical protein n=1 Tax=Cyanobium sp. Morenito 9A2 TaxID=2823718 RepID=UPI0020CE7F27|nr:hypothetical protein [Cyanobium sp. Morenito 9A2]MCP9849331.1 hypothetical protein [Cyanobium sp. Morenito 9A2]